jgi:hypothetical protein
VPFVPPKPAWDRFLILVWQYKTSVQGDLPLYQQAGLRGFHIDRGAGKEATVEFAKANALPYCNDHAADKGCLRLTDRTGRDAVLRKRTVVARPYSLADPKTMEVLKGRLARNVAVTGKRWSTR